MSVFDNLLGVLGLQRRGALSTAHPRDPVLAQWFGGGATAAGIGVTPDSSLRLTAVYACVRLISSAIASLPLDVYRRTDAGAERDQGHPLYPILHAMPNRWQTSYEWREMMAGHLLLRGNAYSEIVGGPTAAVAELIPLHPDRVTPFWAPDGTVAYEYRPPSGKVRTLMQDEVHHLRGLGFDGLKGLSPIQAMRESVGLTIAAEEFGARYFGNNTVIGGVLQTDAALSDKAYERLRDSWKERHQGVAAAHKPQILEEGLKWEALGIPPDQAQFLETRKFQVAEIARIFGVPPHMIGDVEKATSWGTGIEQQGIGFVVYSLRPWLVNWEQAIARDLLTAASRRTHYAQFNVEGLLRGDSAARSQFYREMFNIGALSQNEIRRLENLNRIEGGDTYYVPLNMGPADGEPEPEEGPEDEPDMDPEDDDRSARFESVFRGLFRQAVDRIVTAEVKGLRRALGDGADLAEFERRACVFYERFEAFAMRNAEPLLGDRAKPWVRDHVCDSLTVLTERVNAGAEAVGETIDDWETGRTDLILERHADRAWQEIDRAAA